jgi:hypothetical protein
VYFVLNKGLSLNPKPQQMKHKIEQEIKDLNWALQNKLISVNDYSSMIHSLYQQLKKLN